MSKSSFLKFKVYLTFVIVAGGNGDAVEHHLIGHYSGLWGVFRGLVTHLSVGDTERRVAIGEASPVTPFPLNQEG